MRRRRSASTATGKSLRARRRARPKSPTKTSEYTLKLRKDKKIRDSAHRKERAAQMGRFVL